MLASTPEILPRRAIAAVTFIGKSPALRLANSLKVYFPPQNLDGDTQELTIAQLND
ncbi:hypothetical protein JQC92_19545 [Shewanella sp. 202IG2-18]|uniref:hypothetical protein n=1 Tax=Parashewanella hymeniacidonis TaxID=2807618 RepID=UPI00196134F7|nr:hypothetical protein [Parashewanella hymeniacidonis]MBM7074194.1 hypothetical protein [Parashewanella hymeniacidonis]